MIRISLLLLIVCLASESFAQQSRETFGKNRVQYKQFDWMYLSSDNFDVYYYDGGLVTARQAIDFLEEEFDRMTDIIGYPPYTKTKVFLYNSPSDHLQSNVGLSDPIFSVGGETRFVKATVEVAHPGTIEGLKEELLYRVAQMMINEMMFGGNLKDMFQSAVLMSIPHWFTEGAALYVGKGWSREMDDYMRDYVTRRKVKKLNFLEDEEAQLVGQSIWNFIAERYGRSSISNVLNYTRIIRNEEKSVAVTLGVSFDRLISEWRLYYSEQAQATVSTFKSPEKEWQYLSAHRQDVRFNALKLSPDGSRLAYAYNQNGKFEVRVVDIATGLEKKVLSGGQQVVNQLIDYSLPLVNWADNNTLGIIASRKGVLHFWLYDFETKSKVPMPLESFHSISSFGLSSNGRLAVLSGNTDGQSDLYLLSTRRYRLKRLTNDLYDDIDPAFIPGSNAVVFSSNRPSDTLNTRPRGFKNSTGHYNLYLYDLDTTSTRAVKLTNTLGMDSKPMAINEEEFIYLSDQKGVVNLFQFNVNTGIYSQLTNFPQSIKAYDFHLGTRQLFYILPEGSREHIFLQPSFDISQQRFTPSTFRQQLLQAREMGRRREVVAPPERKVLDMDLEAPDSVQQEKPPVQEKVLPEKFIDTKNYTFENEVVKEKERDTPSTFLAQYRKMRRKSDVIGPLPYEHRFSADNLVTSWVVDPLRGFGILLESQMNDMLENHRFVGGVMTTMDFRSGDIYAEYQYLKWFIDFNARFEREVYYFNTESTLQRYASNVAEVGASLPISMKSRFSVKPFLMSTRFEDLVPYAGGSQGYFFRDPIEEQFVGLRAEFVYDDSYQKDVNLIEGTRAKVSFRQVQGLTDGGFGFANVSVDVRNYFKLYRDIVIATRGYFGTYFGRTPQQYVAGGMDNWLFNRRNTSGDGNPLRNTFDLNRNIYFMEFVTPIRGFDYAELYGRNTLGMNAEFRVPLVRAFSGGTINSGFFRHLQFTAFYDVGSAWTGPSPFNKDNTINFDRIKQGPFEFEVNRFKSPWLMSYGAGFRSVMFGFYMKLDVAWPIQGYDVGKPRPFVTLGYDF
jgi:WD40 repeat protein